MDDLAEYGEHSTSTLIENQKLLDFFQAQPYYSSFDRTLNQYLFSIFNLGLTSIGGINCISLIHYRRIIIFLTFSSCKIDCVSYCYVKCVRLVVLNITEPRKWPEPTFG